MAAALSAASAGAVAHSRKPATAPAAAAAVELEVLLHQAAIQGDATQVAAIFSSSASTATAVDPNCRDRRSLKTPLHEACLHGHTAAAAVLLSHGANANARRANGFTALHYAAAAGHVHTVKLLLLHGAALAVADRCGDTPLHLAARNGSEAVVRLLLEHAAAASPARGGGGGGGGGGAAAAAAAAAGQEGVDGARSIAERRDEVLLSLVGLRNQSGRTALHSAAMHGHTDVVIHLLSCGASVASTDTGGSQPLHDAAAGGHLSTIRALLARGADPTVRDAAGLTPLHRAACGGHVQAAALLLQSAVTADNCCQKPIQSMSLSTSAATHPAAAAAEATATESSGVRAQQLLLCPAAAEQQSASGAACEIRAVSVTSGDIEEGMTPASALGWGSDSTPVLSCGNRREGVGSTMAAAVQASVAEADPDLIRASERMTNEGNGMLHVGVSSVRLVSTAVPCSQVVPLDANGSSPLYWAASHGHADMVSWLLSQPRYSARDRNKFRTALHVAAGWGHEAVCRLLMEHGADVSALDAGGLTAMDVAMKLPQGNRDETIAALHG